MNWFLDLIGKVNLFKGKTVYERYVMNDSILTLAHEKLVAKNKKLLLDNQVPIGKVRFVFQPMFEYDVDKNILNPKYDVMIPVHADSGKFIKDAPEISVNKPHNLIKIPVETYSVVDNYAFLKALVKKSKRGIVIFIVDEMVPDLFNSSDKSLRYHFSVDTDCIRVADLDTVVERYKSQGLL